MSLSLDQSIDTDLSPWAGLFPLSDVTPITAIRLDCEYCGEMVLTALWSDGRADQHRRIFLQIVRATELCSLANTPDVELINSIKQVLD